jgi:P27 family predicted phage terminase small subunit
MTKRKIKLAIRVPETFSDATKRFMKIVVKELNERDELNPLMEGVLVMLMNCYETFVDASRTIRQEGTMTMLTKQDTLQAHPAVAVQLKSNQQVLALMKELGLTIKSRRVLDNAKEDSSALSLFNQSDYED